MSTPWNQLTHNCFCYVVRSLDTYTGHGGRGREPLSRPVVVDIQYIVFSFEKPERANPEQMMAGAFSVRHSVMEPLSIIFNEAGAGTWDNIILAM